MQEHINKDVEDHPVDPYLYSCFKEKLTLPPLPAEEEQKLLKQIEKNFRVLLLPWILTTTNYEDANFLEIGCGDGKYGYYISEYIKHYIGIDIRKVSIQSAQDLLRDRSNCSVLLNDGLSLEKIKDKSQQFIFSYQTFIHMPDESIILGYIKEILRVLAEDGVAKIQLLGPFHKKGYRIEWIKLGTLFPNNEADSKVKWLVKKVFLKILRFVPMDFIFPIFRKNAHHNPWGSFGAFIHPSKIIELVNENDSYAEVLPSFYGSSAGANTYGIYWLIIAKKEAARPFFVTLG